MRKNVVSLFSALIMIIAGAVCNAETVKILDYRFDSGKGTTIKDWSKFQNNATVIGPEWANVIRWRKGGGAIMPGYGAFIRGSASIMPEKFTLKLKIKPGKRCYTSSIFALYVTPFYLKDRTLAWKKGYQKYFPLYYIVRVELASRNRIAVLLSLKNAEGKLVPKKVIFPASLPRNKFSDIIITFNQKQLDISINGKEKAYPAKGKLYYNLPQLYEGHVNGELGGRMNCTFKSVELLDLAPEERPAPKYGLRITTPYYLNFFAENEKKEITVDIENLNNIEKSGKLYFNVSDYEGKQLFRYAKDVTLKPMQSNYVQVVVPIKLRGCFWIKCAFRDANGEVVQRDSQFSVGAIRSVKDFPDSSPFGRCDTSNSIYTKTKKEEYLGDKWIRVLCDWRAFEPEEGKFDFSILDYTINHHINLGRKIYLCMDSHSPKWLKPQKHHFMTPTPQNFKYYERMLRKILNRYKGKISGIDIAGEANARHCFVDAAPEFYLKIAEITKNVRDEYAPKAFLGGPSACRGGWDANTEKYLKKGAGKYWDRLDTHYIGGAAGYYMMPEDSVLQTIRDSRRLMKKYGLNLPIMDSETGYVICSRRAIDGRPMTKSQLKAAKERMEPYISSFTWTNKPRHYGLNSRDELTGAQITVRRMVLCLSEGVGPHMRHGVGTMTYNSEIYPAFSRNLDEGVQLPAIALATMAEKLSWAKYVRKINLNDPNLWGYLFYDRKLKKHLAVLWCSSGTQSVMIDPDSKNAKMCNIWGNPGKINKIGKKLLLKLGESPIYLENVGSKIALGGEPLQIDIAPVINKTNPGNLQITVSNLFGRKLKGTVFVEFPEQLSAGKNKFEIDLKPGEKKQLKTEILPVGKFSGTVVLNVALDSKQTGRLTRLVKLKIESPPTPVKKMPNKIKIDGNGTDWAENIPDLQIREGKQVIRGFPTTFDPQHRDPDRFWQGPEDLSAKFKLGWDKDNLYLLVDVTDPQRNILKWVGGAIRATDGFEMYLDCRKPDNLGKNFYDIPAGMRHMFFSPGTKDDPGVKIRVKGPEGEKLAGMIEAASTETPKGYIVELRIPLTKEFFPHLKMEPGRIIGFNLQINDADKLEKAKSVMMWNGKSKCNNNPKNFGKIVLK